MLVPSGSWEPIDLLKLCQYSTVTYKKHFSQTQISRNFWESSPPSPLACFFKARRVMTPVTVYSKHLRGRGDFVETLKIESPINYGTPLVHMRQDRGMMFGDVTP